MIPRSLDPRRAWTRRDLLAEGVRLLDAAAVEDARRNAEWMLGDLLGEGRAQLHAYAEDAVDAAVVAAYEAMLERRAAREPLQYVLGYAEFYGLRLRVTPDVLIPRPETEQVVEEALHLLADVDAPRVLDVGTGSGCIPLAIKHERPDAVAAGCDVSKAALDVARANADRLGLAVTWHQADLLAADFTGRVPGRLDLLISNPPYVPTSEAVRLQPEVRDFEPALALFAGDDPLRFYRALVRQAPALLRRGGHVVFETHADHGSGVCDLLRGASYTEVRLVRDLAGLPRIATARLEP